MLNDWVSPLALPSAGLETEPGTSCTLSGWGNTQVRGIYTGVENNSEDDELSHG